MAENNKEETFNPVVNSKHERNLDRIWWQEQDKKKGKNVWDLKRSRWEAEDKIRKESNRKSGIGFYAYDLVDQAALLEERNKVISKKELADAMRGNRDYMEEIHVELEPLPLPWRSRHLLPKECGPGMITRLLQDLKEIRQNPLATVNAQPLGNNLSHWHGNLRPMSGAYAGVTFHISLSFPPDYPQAPPHLFLYTPIPHPNIFDGYVCCDMLSTYASMKFRGWSSCYTVQSILIQLQTFLTDENVTQQGSDAIETNFETVEFVDATKEQIDSFVCPEKECMHSYDNPNPELPPLEVDGNIVAKPLGYTLPPPRNDPKNRLNARDRSGKIELSEDGLGMSTTAAKGWWGCRSERGYIIAGVYKGTSLYFETLILGKGVCRIGFSFKGARYNLGKDHNGWGYGGTGKKSHDDVFSDFGSGYRKGDVIGCALDLTKGKIVYFKNGKCEGEAFQIPLDCDGWTFYPTVSIRNNSVRVNFGEKGFRYYPKEFASPRGKGERPGNVEDVFNPYDIEVPFIKKAIEKKKMAEERRAKRIADLASIPPEKNPRIPMNGKNYFETLAKDTVLSLLEFFEYKDLYKLSKTCKIFHDIIRSHLLFEKLDLKCYYTKKSYTNTILGHPIISSKYQNALQSENETPKNDSMKALKAEQMKMDNKLSSTLDVVSYDGYMTGNILNTVWNVKFGYFLPIIISRRFRHKNRILEILRDNICKIYLEKLRFKHPTSSYQFYNSGGSYEPKQAISVLGRLMTSMTSSIYPFIDEQEKKILEELKKVIWQYNEEPTPTTLIYAAKNALRGYFSFHQMLLALYETSPETLEDAGNKFIKDCSDKASSGDLRQTEVDEFITSVIVTKSSWNDIKLKYLEIMCRRWAKQFPSLNISTNSDSNMLPKLFEELKHAWKSCLVQVYFLRNFGKPENSSVKQLLENYDMTFAHPTNKQHKELFEFCKMINGFTKWDQVIKCLEVDVSEDQLIKYFRSQ